MTRRHVALKTTHLITCVLIVILCCHGIAFAGKKGVDQEKGKLQFKADIRFRAEYYNNFNAKNYGDQPTVGEKDDGFMLSRIRLGIHYKPNKKLYFALGIQDSKEIGLSVKPEDFYKATFDRIHDPYEDTFELFNTYVEIKEVLPFDIKAGRMCVGYGNKRVFGPGAWGNVGRWHWDRIVFRYEFKHGFIDPYFGQVKIHDPYVFSWTHEAAFRSFGFYSQFKVPTENDTVMAFEPMAFTKTNDKGRFNSEDKTKGNLKMWFIGTRFFVKNYKGLDGDFTYLKQNGEQSIDDVDAYGIHFLAAYNFKYTCKPRASLEYTYGSGDSDPNDGTIETFDGAFGSRAKVMGRMNLHFWKNLKDLQFNFESKPTKMVSFKAEYHRYWLANAKDAWYFNPKYRDKTGMSGDEIGSEFDICTTFKLPKNFHVEMIYGHFWPGEFTKNLASDVQANWLSVQWGYNFSHFVK
ncbi:alginate export family protein [Acidobacteriota bacterium]